MASEGFDAFISYQWDSKPFVKKLYERLTTTFEYSVWLDDQELGNDSLNDQLVQGIKDSTLMICCITQKYCESENCKRELDYASSLKKPLIIIMLEKLDMVDAGGVGFIINSLARYNFYKEKDVAKLFSSEMFESMINAIQAIHDAEDDDDDEDKE